VNLLQIYWGMTLLACVFAACAGGKPGRWGVIIFTLKTVFGFYLGLLDQSWIHPAFPMLGLDVFIFLAFTALALNCDRYWPLWSAGCASAAVAVHIAAITQVGFKPEMYHGLRGLMAIPMQLFMVRGIWLDGRHVRSLHSGQRPDLST
jgi:hypothetical protein